MQKFGITIQQAKKHFQEWANEDFYFSLFDELNSLCKAGISQPECFWRKGPFAVFGGLANT